MNEITFEQFREKLLYHYITEWDEDTIILDNGIKISIVETEQDCCAGAWGRFIDVQLDAAITSVSDIKYQRWEDDDTYGCSAMVKFMHNRNVICRADANADAGNGGYYYSIASFVIYEKGEEYYCHFVGSDD